MKNSLKAAAWTALFTFLGMFGITLLGFLQEVASWAGSSGTTPFPEVSVLGYGLIAAAVAAVIGIVNFVVRYAQTVGVIPGRAPEYSPAPAPYDGAAPSVRWSDLPDGL